MNANSEGPRPSILIITDLFPSPTGHNFSGVFVVDQLRALSRYVDIHVLVPYERSLRREAGQPELKDDTRLAGLSVHYGGFFSWSLLFLSIGRRLAPALLKKTLIRTYQKRVVSIKLRHWSSILHEQYHFTFVHGHETGVGDEAGPIGKHLGIPSFVTLHSLAPFVQAQFDDKTWQKIIHNINQVSAVITVSHLAKDSYGTLIKRPWRIVANGYTPNNSPQPTPPILKKLGGMTVILFVGFLIPTKKPDLLVEAVAEIIKRGAQNVALVIIGQGPMQTQIEKRIIQLGLEHLAVISTEEPVDSMAAFYQRADFVVQPSVSESFSMVCLEAMAYGKPFICTSSAGIAEYVTPLQQGIIVPPNDLSALTDAMLQLANDPALRYSLGQAGVKLSMRFRWDSIVKELAKVYSEFVPGISNL